MPPKRKDTPVKAPKGKGKAAPPKPTKQDKGKGKATAKPSSESAQKVTRSKFDIIFPVSSRPAEEPIEPTPGPWDGRVRSFAERERNRFKLSRASLDSDYELTPEALDAFASTLQGGGADSWGRTKTGPQQAARKKRRRVVALVSNGVDAGEHLAMLSGGTFMAKRVPIPNVPGEGKRYILTTSKEVREVIYGFLFVYEKPIRVKYTWEEVERNSYGRRNAHKLIRACKLFALEVPAFLLRNNTINALLRKPHSGHIGYVLHDESRKIPPPLLANVRNLVLDCARDCWNLDWFKDAAKGLRTVANAAPSIESLTLVIAPHKELRTQTALGIEANPLAFADFLWWGGKFMQAVQLLAPKVIKVVVKKHNKEVRFEVDMARYRRLPMEVGPLANPLTVESANRKSRIVEEKLEGMKAFLEEIFEDEMKAVAEGRCNVKVPEEQVVVKHKEGHYRRMSVSEMPIDAERIVLKKRKAMDVIDLTSDTEDDEVHAGPSSASLVEANNSALAGAGVAGAEDEVKVESSTTKIDLSSVPAATQSSASPFIDSFPSTTTAGCSFNTSLHSGIGSIATPMTSFNSEYQDPSRGSFLTHREWRLFTGLEPELDSETDVDDDEEYDDWDEF